MKSIDLLKKITDALSHCRVVFKELQASAELAREADDPVRHQEIHLQVQMLTQWIDDLSVLVTQLKERFAPDAEYGADETFIGIDREDMPEGFASPRNPNYFLTEKLVPWLGTHQRIVVFPIRQPQTVLDALTEDLTSASVCTAPSKRLDARGQVFTIRMVSELGGPKPDGMLKYLQSMKSLPLLYDQYTRLIPDLTTYLGTTDHGTSLRNAKIDFVAIESAKTFLKTGELDKMFAVLFEKHPIVYVCRAFELGVGTRKILAAVKGTAHVVCSWEQDAVRLKPGGAFTDKRLSLALQYEETFTQAVRLEGSPFSYLARFIVACKADLQPRSMGKSRCEMLDEWALEAQAVHHFAAENLDAAADIAYQYGRRRGARERVLVLGGRHHCTATSWDKAVPPECRVLHDRLMLDSLLPGPVLAQKVSRGVLDWLKRADRPSVPKHIIEFEGTVLK